MPQVPGGDLSLFEGEDGPTWHEMKPFWRTYRPWLAARGFHLFESISDELSMGYVFPPPTQCLAALPYAIYADIELEISIWQITPPVSEFNVGELWFECSIGPLEQVRARP